MSHLAPLPSPPGTQHCSAFQPENFPGNFPGPGTPNPKESREQKGPRRGLTLQPKPKPPLPEGSCPPPSTPGGVPASLRTARRHNNEQAE